MEYHSTGNPGGLSGGYRKRQRMVVAVDDVNIQPAHEIGQTARRREALPDGLGRTMRSRRETAGYASSRRDRAPRG